MIGKSIYNTALNMKLVWNNQANHMLSNVYVFPCGCNPRLMYPDILQWLIVCSFPEWCVAIFADLIVSLPVNFLMLFANIGW